MTDFGPHDQTTDLYRFFDARDRLLYIGISLHAATRASDHRKNQPWWPEVERMTVEHLKCGRQEALAIERHAIETERPLHNIVHNRTPGVPSITWWCDGCGEEIGDNAGYIEMPNSERRRYKTEKAEWDKRVSNEQAPSEHGFKTVNLNLLLSAPEEPTWIVVHRECDPHPDSTGYWIGVERCRTQSQLLDWCAHLMEKPWVFDTTWTDIIRRANGNLAR